MVHKPPSLEMTPVDLPPEIVTALAPFAPLFSDRVWAKAQLLAVGALLVNGRRTVASALRIMGQAGERHFTNYHRVLNRDAWSCLAAGQVLLGLILAVLPKDAPLVLAADDTIERRNGRRIAAKGCYRDPVRSSVKHPIRCFGLKWVCLAVLVPVPWGGRPWALPLLTALSWPAGKGPRRGHKSSIDWARQLILQVRRWVPERELILVTDGGFAAVELASDCRRHRVTLVCRLRIDAALYDPPAVPPPGRRGPKPKKGPRQPSPKRRAADPATAWESVEVDWYGGRRKAMRVVSGTGLWHTPHLDPVPIRHVLARDPEGQQRDAAYLCTDERFTAGAGPGPGGATLEPGGDLRGGAGPPGDGDAAAVVGPGDRADHAGAAGAVLARHAAGGAVAWRGRPGGGAGGVVRQGGADVLGLPGPGPPADLAEPN